MDNKKPKSRRTTAQTKAEARYRQKRVGKTVFFNVETEQHLIDAAEEMDNYSGWVKMKLEKYLQEKQNIK